MIRDLKPENFLYTSQDEMAPLKIIDFGLSKVFGEDVFDIEKIVTRDLLAEGKKVKKKRKKHKKSSRFEYICPSRWL